MSNTFADKGFTIVELIVAIVIMSILSVSVINFATVQFKMYVMANERTLLAAAVEQQLQTIGDELRDSTGVAQYNLVPDSNAPQSLLATGTTGPYIQSHFWRSSSNSLVIERVPTDTDGNPIYDNTVTLSGDKDYIVYYIRDGALYRRIIPADYPNNKEVITPCVPVLAAGGCNSDRKLLEGLASGMNGFRVAYLNKDSTPIDTSSSFAAVTGAAGVSISLEAQTRRVGQTIEAGNTVAMMFRKDSKSKLELPASVVTGAGGIYMFGATIKLLDVATKGCLRMANNSSIGTAAEPAYVAVGGVNPSFGYGVSCLSDTVNIYTSRIYGDVCAKDQTKSTNPDGGFIAPGSVGTKYTQGLVLGCVPPFIDSIPKYDRAAHLARMTQAKLGAQASCTSAATAKVVDANTKYTGEVNLAGCQETLKGDVYIEGDLRITSSSRLIVDESLTERPIIVTTGQVYMFAGQIVPNSRGVSPYVVSYLSSDATCSITPTCDTISATNMEQSLSVNAISLAAGSSAPSTLFNSQFSRVYLFNGAVQAGGVAGQSLQAAAGATVVLDE